MTIDKKIEEVGGFLLKDYKNVSSVYQNINGEFKRIIKPTGSRCDPHTHTKYSSEIIGAGTTSFIGVKESENHVEEIADLYFKNGMDFISISDHNTVKGFSDLKNHNKSFMSCEYDVAVVPGYGDKLVHVVVYGLDYPNLTSKRISEEEIGKIHNHLMDVRIEGAQKFKEECEKFGLIPALAHPALIVTPKKPLNAKELSEICDVFDYLEINGDVQKENILTLELALEKNKILVAGNDRHSLRKPHVYMETLRSVEHPWEFLQELKKGYIGIGSFLREPKMKREINPFDILKSQFNGTRLNLYEDIYRGIWHYFTRNNSLKKWGVVSGVSLTTVFVPPLSILGAAYLLGTFPIKYGMAEKKATMKRTIKLYDDYCDLKFKENLEKIYNLQEMDDKEKKQNLKNLKKETELRKKQFKKISFWQGTRWWERTVQKILPGGEEFFTPYYHFSIPNKEE